MPSPRTASTCGIIKAAFLGATVSFAATALAEDVLLKVSTKVGDEKAQLSEHTIAAGKEATIYDGALYKVVVTPTVQPSPDLKLAFKVFDAGSNVPVSAPTLVTQIGARTGLAVGSERSSKALYIEFIPTIKQSRFQ